MIYQFNIWLAKQDLKQEEPLFRSLQSLIMCFDSTSIPYLFLASWWQSCYCNSKMQLDWNKVGIRRQTNVILIELSNPYHLDETFKPERSKRCESCWVILATVKETDIINTQLHATTYCNSRKYESFVLVITGYSGFNSSTFYIYGNTCRSKLHPFLVRMCKHQGWSSCMVISVPSTMYFWHLLFSILRLIWSVSAYMLLHLV